MCRLFASSLTQIIITSIVSSNLIMTGAIEDVSELGAIAAKPAHGKGKCHSGKTGQTHP